MRISSLQIHSQGLNALLDQQRKLFDTQLQISTGRRIVQPADDPTGSARLLDLGESMAITEQYQANIGAARGRLQLEETTLDGVVGGLQRARELVVRGLNDTLGPEDRAAIAVELREILDETLSLANRRDASGEYIFAGNRTRQPPFEADGSGNFRYLGDQGQRYLQVGPTRQVPVGDSGFDVFMKVPAPGGGYQDIFTTLYQAAEDMANGAGNPDSITAIDNSLDRVLAVQSDIGARLNSLDREQGVNESYLLQLEEAYGNIQDLDIAEAAARLSQKAATLQAAQSAFVQTRNLSLFDYL